MHVRVTVDDPTSVDREAVDTAVAEVLPPYVVHELEVVER